MAQAPPPLPAMPTFVKRADIRSLPKEKQEVYVNAVKQMMMPGWRAKPDHDIGVYPAKFPCEFLRLASYHGWPGKDVGGSAPDEEDYWSGYCAHQIETFPTWHRAYLTDYEQTLQAADAFLRGEEKAKADPVAAHYWGWDTESQARFPKEPFPEAMDAFSGGYFKEYVPMIMDWLMRYQPVAPQPGDPKPHVDAYKAIMEALEYVKKDQLYLSGAKDINAQMQMYQVTKRLNMAWTATTFPTFSNTTLGVSGSLESPHNAVHLACGGVMVDNNVASFHPVFFLHHSNVDRLLEAWLEDKRRQNAQPWLQFFDNNAPLYEEELTPFVHPADASVKMSSRYSFQDTEKLGYKYDNLPAVPKPPSHITPMARIVKRTTQVQFQALSRAAMVTSLNIHVFVLRKDEAFNPPADVLQFLAMKSFAGTIPLFGSKGPACETCAKVEPQTLSTDATDALVAQLLHRNDARIEVVVQKAINGQIISFEDSGLPTPVFAQVAELGHTTHAGARAAAHHHHVDDAGVAKVKALQTYLKRYGWYAGAVDGVYGPATDSAVQRFEGRFGLPLVQADDDHYFVNQETRALMATARYNSRRDVGSFERTYDVGSTVAWFVDAAPAGAAADVAAAIAQWAGAIPKLTFQQATSCGAADLVIAWGALPATDAAAEGFGGALAHVDASTGKATVTLDASKVGGAYRSLPVLLHTIGSALGLGNSFHSAEVMYPFYSQEAAALTAADKAKGAAKYP